MAKVTRKLNRFGRKNAGMLAVLGVLLAVAFLAFPAKVQEGFEDVKESDPFGDLLDLGHEDVLNITGPSAREIQVRYESGRLSALGEITVEGAGGSDFAVEGTATTGAPAKFELWCGSDVCGSITDLYEEPVTVWIVTVPDDEDVTQLVVVAGAARLEVDL